VTKELKITKITILPCNYCLWQKGIRFRWGPSFL